MRGAAATRALAQAGLLAASLGACGRFNFGPVSLDGDGASADSAQEGDAVDLDCGATNSTTRTSCAEIHAECPNAASGERYIVSCGAPKLVYCDMATDVGGWTVIDLNRDASWQGCFSEWMAGTGVAGAGTSCSTWRTWFTASTPTMQFRRSPTCGDVSGAVSDEVYRWTGNNYGCVWFNDNCDYSGTCTSCLDDNSSMNNGTCPWLEQTTAGDPAFSADYDYCFNCSIDWWNSAPSIGTAGTNCVAYRDI